MTTTSTNHATTDQPRPSVSDIQQLAAGHLSMPSRLWHTVLVVASLSMATAIVSLWTTEPHVPPRLHAAFAAIVAVALTWAGFGVWVLVRRRVLFGRDRVLAGWLAVAFTTISAVGLLLAGAIGGFGTPAYVGAAGHSVLCAAAIWLLVSGRRRVRALSERRRKLEAALTPPS
jgi:hypothetical protein